MSTHKRIDGDYVISTINSEDYVVINTHTVEINGNLDVEGNLTYINVTELNVKDPFIVLNSSNTASYPSNSGVLTHKTVSDFAGIRYDNTVSAWQISTSTDATGLTGTWSNIAIGSASVAGANREIQFNDNGGFGANANLTFNKASSRLILDGAFVLAYTTNSPSSIASSSTVTSQSPNTGDTGIYFTNASNTDELISRNRAFVWSLIL